MTVSTPAVPTPTDGIAKTPQEQERLDVFAADYRAGIKGLRQLGAEHGMSHTAARKLGERLGLTRDLQAKINARTEAKLARAAASTATGSTPDSTGTGISERVIVEANANAQYEVRVAHRAAIQRTRRVLESLLTELEHQLTDPVALAKALEAIGDAMPEAKRVELATRLAASVGTGSRLAMLKQAADALTRVVDLERQAFNIRPEVAEQRDDPLSLLLRQVMGQRTAPTIVGDDPAHQA